MTISVNHTQNASSSQTVQQAAKASEPPKTVIEAAKADSLSIGERFVHGAVEGTKAAAIPSMITGAVYLAATEPNNIGLAMLAGPAVGLMGAGLAGAVIGGSANALGAGKAVSVTGGAAAGAAAGWALNNLGNIKSRAMSAGAGAAIGAAAAYAGSGGKMSGDQMLNNAAGGMAGIMLTAGVAIVMSGGKELGGWANLAVLAGGAVGFYAANQLQK